VRQTEVETIVRRFLYGVGDSSQPPDGALATSFVDHTTPAAGSGSSRQDASELLLALKSVMSNLQIRIQEVIVAGDTAVVRWSASGTLRLWLLPPLELTAEDMTHVFRVENGAITDVWSLDGRPNGDDDDDDDDEDDDEDDDNGGGGPAPPGPRWIPRKPPPKPKPPPAPPGR
jgi:SnoaL-like polyketide cyclase